MHVHHCHCSYMTLNQSCCKKIFEYMCETTVGVFFFFFFSSNMPAFRQVGEKQLPNPVLCMAWSPRRDLIALANTTGEVTVLILFLFLFILS